MVSAGELEMGTVCVQVHVVASSLGADSVASIPSLDEPLPPLVNLPQRTCSNETDDGLCTICYDRPATCVLLECGHGGYCWRCAHVLYARPPNECPVCRQRIEQVVEMADPSASIGHLAQVKDTSATRGKKMSSCFDL
jgi:hypothetical protein